MIYSLLSTISLLNDVAVNQEMFASPHVVCGISLLALELSNARLVLPPEDFTVREQAQLHMLEQALERRLLEYAVDALPAVDAYLNAFKRCAYELGVPGCNGLFPLNLVTTILEVCDKKEVYEESLSRNEDIVEMCAATLCNCFSNLDKFTLHCLTQANTGG